MTAIDARTESKESQEIITNASLQPSLEDLQSFGATLTDSSRDSSLGKSGTIDFATTPDIYARNDGTAPRDLEHTNTTSQIDLSAGDIYSGDSLASKITSTMGRASDAATRGQFSDGSLPGDLANETIETMSGIGDAALEIAGSGRRRDMIDQVDPALLREAAPLFEHALSTRDLSKLDEFMDHHFPDDGSQAAENQRTAFLVRMALDRNGDQSEARQLGGAWSDIRVMRPGGRQDYANAEHFLLQGTYGASEYTGEVLNGAVMPAVYNLGKEVAGSPVDVFGVEPETITELHKNWTGVKDEAAAGEFSDGTFLGDLRNAAIEKVAQVMQLATTPMGSEPSLNQYAWQMAGFNQGRQSRDN